jgi:hypothetical protein
MHALEQHERRIALRTTEERERAVASIGVGVTVALLSTVRA